MDPLSSDNAIYEDVEVKSSHEGFNIHENKCYGKVTSTAIKKHEEKRNSYSKVIIMAFVIVFALLLGTAGACVAFALQITMLTSEIETLKMVSSTSLEEVGHQLNTSLYQQLNQQNASIYFAFQQLNGKLSQQLNTSIDMVHQQLSQQNDSAYQQLDEKNQQLNSSIDMLYQKLLEQISAASSCKDLYDTRDASSGYYWIGEVGSAVRVYCNMSLTCGNMTGGWMRVANIDMTNTSQNCPSGLTLITSPKRVCDFTSTGCVSTEFDVHGVQYSHVCGRVIAYQNRVPIAYQFQSRGFEADYVYGVSLTHGQNPREHIWTFAGASDETSFDYLAKCPCINTNIDPPPPVPSFIGSDYFCDTEFEIRWNSGIPDLDSVHISDPLWDGEGCGSTNTCCYDPQREVNPPWFVKTLSSPTSDNIEMRLCRPTEDGSTPFEIVELYVQ